MYWQLYDSYLQPNGAFYGTKKANTPLHAIYRYGFDDIFLSNESLKGKEKLTVKVVAYDSNSNIIYSREWKGNIESNTSKFILKLPETDISTKVWFLDLRIIDSRSNEIDNNFYWLSTQEDVLDYEAAKKLEWQYYTPTKEYADFKELFEMENAELKVDFTTTNKNGNTYVDVVVKNTSNKISFFNYFDLINAKTGNNILPVYWSDNYISLLPNETKTITAYYTQTIVSNDNLNLIVRGVNTSKILQEQPK
jgi:exo-1,4-beta-D-glucosaminidase